MARLNADVPDELRKRLLHALVDDDLSFRHWLIRAIESYLSGAEKESKEKQPGPGESKAKKGDIVR